MRRLTPLRRKYKIAALERTQIQTKAALERTRDRRRALKRERNKNMETKEISWTGICLSCEYWTGVRCAVNRRRREATETCGSAMEKHYRANRAYLAKKKSFEE